MMRKVKMYVLCLLVVAIVLQISAEETEKELLEPARLGEANYQISIHFLQDSLSELTPDQRRELILKLSDKRNKGEISLLETYTMIRLLYMEGLFDDEAKITEVLTHRLDSILTKDQKNLDAVFVLVKLKRWEGDDSGVMSLLNDSALWEKFYSPLWLELADLYFEYREYERAGEAVDLVLKDEPENTEALIMKTNISSTKILTNLLNEELWVFKEELAKYPPEERLKITFAQIETTIDRVDFSPIHQAIELNPERFEFHFFVGAVQEFIVYMHYLMLIGSYEQESQLPELKETQSPLLKEIKSYLDTAIKQRPSGDVDAFMAMAMYYLVLSDFDRAKEFAQQAVEARPDIDEPYDALVTIINFQWLLFEDDRDAGIRESCKVLEEKRENKKLQFIDRLMLIHPLIQEKNYEEALSELGKIENDFPEKKIPSLLFRGGLLLRMGKVDEGLTTLNEIIKSEPNNVDVHYNLGLAYFVKGQLDIALEHLKQASQLNPQDEEVIELINKVEASR
ncbi:MAG: tetratricopeptide repeat protein [Candidatus Cloacimonadota bacterium]|nr:MAG: tetratricopeptide repeat protein [Candidatus Cloacimonadota bacterium]